MVLNTDILERAYRHGYFPMADPTTGEIAWYCPDPRAILPLNAFHVSRSLRRTLRKQIWTVTYNHAFTEVMRACADREEGSWMSEEFFRAYTEMHHVGKAHSVEIWESSELVGGVYGVALGRAFFAESKFHRRTDASKAALYYLVQVLNACDYRLLEVQFLTKHLETLGAVEIPLEAYMRRLRSALLGNPKPFPSPSREQAQSR